MTRPDRNPLLTDLYQLTMMQAYFEHGMTDVAVFEFFVRRLPPQRNFLLAAGLRQAVEYLENLRFDEVDLDWIRGCGRFSRDFADELAKLRFTGDLHAMPEGTAFFADEPILRVVAPLPVAQLVETRLINILHFQTLVASKAARMVLCAPDKLLVDFGLRRAHGAEAGHYSARASFIAGFGGSANVLAAMQFGIPVYGTMAHSYVEACDSEIAAFEGFAHSHPDNVTLLIDTYDTAAAARKVVALAPKLRDAGVVINAVRIDSGDLAVFAGKVRQILDEGGLGDVRIFSSGGLDEYDLRDFLRRKVPIDGFGIGTHLDTSSDAPYLDCAYKLEEYAGRGRRKRSSGKATWPGRKQVYRRYDAGGRMLGDILTLHDDEQAGEPLIRPVMRAGKPLQQPESLQVIRERAGREYERLPPALKKLEQAPPYQVTVAPALQALARAVDAATADN